MYADPCHDRDSCRIYGVCMYCMGLVNRFSAAIDVFSVSCTPNMRYLHTKPCRVYLVQGVQARVVVVQQEGSRSGGRINWAIRTRVPPV